MISYREWTKKFPLIPFHNSFFLSPTIIPLVQSDANVPQPLVDVERIRRHMLPYINEKKCFSPK